MVQADVMTPALTALSHSPLVAPHLVAPQGPKVIPIASFLSYELLIPIGTSSRFRI